MANVYKDEKRNTWYYSLYCGIDEITGKKEVKVKRGFKSKADAQSAYTAAKYKQNNRKKSQKNRKGKRAKSSSNVTLKEYYEFVFYPRWKKTVKNQTAENTKFITDKKFSELMDMPLKEIQRNDVQLWLDQLSHTRNIRTNQVYTNAYVNRCLCILKTILKSAQQDRYIEEDPSHGVKRLPVNAKTVEIWTLDDFNKVMEYFDQKSIKGKFKRLSFYTLFTTGMRIGELGGLRWEDVDYDCQAIRIQYNLVYKGKKFSDGYYIDTPKTMTSRRTISIPQNLVEMLKEWEEIQQKIERVSNVFFYDGKPFCPHTYRTWLNKAADAQGVKRIKIHGLRHSHASYVISQGNISIKQLQQRLGHSSIKITLDTYGHLYPADDQKISELFDKNLF